MSYRYSFSANVEKAQEFEERLREKCDDILSDIKTVPSNGKAVVESHFDENHEEAETAITDLLDELGIESDDIERELELSFHGRIIDHLGIQMYQSPVAAVAEMVSNSWDADSTEVEIDLPEDIDSDVFSIADDGNGMTYEECEEKYLTAGLDPRDGDPEATTQRYDRPLLGRKGIGKFAGFGIARRLTIETISIKTGEHTVFEMNLDDIRGDGTEYAGDAIGVDVLEYHGPSEDRKEKHGTTVILSDLMMGRASNPDQFRRSMGRRFTLQERADNFEIYVNDEPMSDDRAVAGIQFSFPEDYEEEEKPDTLDEVDEEGWGLETLDDGSQIRWKFDF